MESVHPLKYISQTFQIPLADVAKELGVSRQTVNEWVGKRKKPIPEKHIPKLSKLFQLDEIWFRKSKLLGSQRLELQRIYIDRNATFIDYEEPFIDAAGNEHWIKKSYSPEEPASRHLYLQQLAKELLEEIETILDLEVEEDNSFYQDILSMVISLTKTKDKRKVKMLQDVLSYLLYHDNEFGFLVETNKQKTQKLNEILELYS